MEINNSFIQDSQNRRINYLRLSVTDRCNLRCSYCMPAKGMTFVDRQELLTRQELITVAQMVLELGIRKIRITGGEPLVRPDILEILAELGSLPKLEYLAITTNGLLLEPIAQKLQDAGVGGANISLDSLDPDRFRDITRGGDLKRCLAGIDAAIAAGMRTKINMVVMAGVNDDEISDFVDFARTRPVAVRFIEYMPTRGNASDQKLTLPTADLLERLSQTVTLEPIERPGGLTMAGPARNFIVPGALGRIGVISPVTCNFCDDCNRVRITATGLARGCLFHENGLDLKPWLRPGDMQGLKEAMSQVVYDKPISHGLDDDDGPSPFAMSRVGG